MISVVCVYNNNDLLEEMLLKSLKNQKTNYELILMDNTESKYGSAAEALNIGGQKSSGDYIIFTHQDVKFLSDYWLVNAEKTLNSIVNLGIAGIAGIPNDKETVLSNIFQGVPPKIVGKIKLDYPMQVETLDECLLFIPRKIFSELQFDSVTCNSWHMYGIDYCMAVQELGYNVYVLPMDTYHKSTGLPLTDDYYDSLERVRKKYRYRYKRINTTSGKWSTLVPIGVQRIPIFNQKMKRFFRYILSKFRLY